MSDLVWLVKNRYEMPADCYSIFEIRQILPKYIYHKGDDAWNKSHITINELKWLAKISGVELYAIMEGRITVGLVVMERLARTLEKTEHGLIIKKNGYVQKSKKPTQRPEVFHRVGIDFRMTGRPVVCMRPPKQPSSGLMGLPNPFKTGKRG